MVQVWRKPAENASNFLKKGSQVAVNGRINTRNYENDKGDRVYVTEVVADFVQFLDPKPQGQGNQYGQGYKQPQGQGNHQQQPNSYGGNNQYGASGSVAVSDEDLPF